MDRRKHQNGRITLLIILLTWTLVALFGILIARATYRAMIHNDTQQYVQVVFLNDSLERIRTAIINEVASWASI